jgi:hypothetical protein
VEAGAQLKFCRCQDPGARVDCPLAEQILPNIDHTLMPNQFDHREAIGVLNHYERAPSFAMDYSTKLRNHLPPPKAVMHRNEKRTSAFAKLDRPIRAPTSQFTWQASIFPEKTGRSVRFDAGQDRDTVATCFNRLTALVR